MADVVVKLVQHFDWHGPVGVTFPGVVRRGVVHTAANVDKAWVDVDADALFTKAVGGDVEVHVVNDADAAGLAEVTLRRRQGRGGRGPAADVRHRHRVGLVPRRQARAEHRARPHRDRRPRRRAQGRRLALATARACRGRTGPSGSSSTSRPSCNLLSPDLIIVGGGASRKADKWLPHIDVGTKIVPAALENEAGIVGAAVLVAAENPVE